MVVEPNSEARFRYLYQPHRWHPREKIIRLVGSYKRVLDVGYAS